MTFRIMYPALLTVALAFSFANAEENMEITTYYPSPAGIYETFRLVPRERPSPCREGEMYYDNGAAAPLIEKGLYICNNTEAWVPFEGIPSFAGIYKWEDNHGTCASPNIFLTPPDCACPTGFTEKCFHTVGYDPPNPIEIDKYCYCRPS